MSLPVRHGAFDLTEQLQTPVFVLSDLDIGMNNWMSDRSSIRQALKRGKVLSKKTWTPGCFERYKDVDGDAIHTATLPERIIQGCLLYPWQRHNEKALYTERDDYQNLMERLARKFETARTMGLHRK